MPGDRIALVAPASGFDRVGFDRGVQEVRRLGFEPVYTEAVFERAFFTAGAPEPRAVDFTRAWEDPSVAALLAIRGGYGSMQILPLLDRLRPAARPKLFIGYSDVTAILTWLTCHHEVAAIHGPMIEGRLAEGTERYDELSFASLLRGDAGFELAPAGLDVLRPGEVRGPMFGGTITQLTASLGTPFAFAPPDECVLFLEDVNERPYRLHRLLTHLRLGGVLARARALVFGEMTGCDEPGGVTAMDVIRDVTQGFAGPVLVGFPSGHTTGACWSLPFGVAVTVTTHPRPAVVVEESAVE
jgi:muramoyltetrapeptide carboxypeptidase